MATIELTQHQKEDKAFILHPDRGTGYPNWPFLPMKKYRVSGGMSDGGTIIDRNPMGSKVDRNHECFRTVYLVSIWQASREKKSIVDYEKKVYASVDEMLADGWQVD